MLQQEIRQLKNRCLRIKSQGKHRVLLIRRKKMFGKINGGDNSTDSKNTNLDKRAIHIHGRMEHN